MSTIKVDTITSSDGLGAPELPYGLAISAAFTLNGTGNAYINRSVNSGSLTFAGGTGIDAGQTSGGLIARGNTDSYNAGGVEVYSGGSERLVINSAGSVGIGTDALTDNYKTIIEGSDQETANLTDAGAHGATLFLRATGENVGSGGAVAFGTTYGNQRPFAAIKGFITDGTSNSVGDLAFSTRATTSDTNLSERMRITSTGVGIGASSPITKLDVNSVIFARPDTTALTSEVKAVASDFLSLPSFINTGSKQFGSTASGTTVGLSNASLGLLEFINCSAGLIYTNGLSPIVFATNNTERMRINSSGSVGIGLSSPEIHGKVAIQGGKAADSNSNLSLLTDGAAQGELADLSLYGTFEGTADNTPRRTADIAAGFEGGNWGTEYLAFHVGNGGVANDDRLLTTERVRIDGSGRVGIGTSSPASKLNVVSGTNDGITVNDGTVNTILFNTSSANGSVGTTTYHPMAFYTNNTERMRINSSGSVGIGTTTPAAKLEIGGAGEGIILASPDGTRYEITVANGGTLTVTAV